MSEEEEEKKGLEALDSNSLAEIVAKGLEEGEGLGRQASAPYIAFYELAKRSGWDLG